MDAFDGKAYQFTGSNNGGYIAYGGIKGTGVVVGRAYTLSLKIDMGTCDYLFVEYVSTGGQGSVNGYGALKLYPDGSLLPNDGSNMTATYDAATKTLSVTVVAGMKVWDENTSEPGFFQLVGYKADLDSANLIIDDVCLKEADEVFYEDWETFVYGDDITFTVTVADGYRLIAVRLNGEKVNLTNGAYTVTGATEDINLVVVAEKIPEYAMSYTANEGGSVTSAWNLRARRTIIISQWECTLRER